jgi:hypothetical protein
MTLADWIGALGVALLLVAFFANAFGFLRADSRAYHGLNAAGSAIACVAALLIGFVPFVVLDGVWCAVAVVALVRRTSRSAG